jgi:uncharacterized protein
MQLNQNLYNHFCEQAAHIQVTSLTIGLRYTAVATDDGGIGIAFTDMGRGHSCGMGKDYLDFEGRPAMELLAFLKHGGSLQRSMALALVNALNYTQAARMPEDSTDGVWMDTLGIGHDTHVAMVGFFRPLMHKFKARGAIVEVLDAGMGIGDRGDFYRKLEGWADALLLTSTSIINNTTEEVLGRLNSNAKAVMLGPSTPMVPRAFAHLPVACWPAPYHWTKKAFSKRCDNSLGYT